MGEWALAADRLSLTMAIPAHLYTPVSPPNGGDVHATSLSDAGKTVCGRAYRGWVIHPSRLTCKKCKERLVHPVQPGTKLKSKVATR